MSTKTGSIAASLCAAAATASFAAPAEVQTPAPVIHLIENLDEADGLGWCIDTVGRGFSDRLHTHSCKPQGGDVQFGFDADTGHIFSATYDGLCMTRPGDPDAPLGLLECTAGDAAQMFAYDADTMTIHPVGAAELCLSVGDASRSAGPFMSRDLSFSDCAATTPELKSWIIQE